MGCRGGSEVSRSSLVWSLVVRRWSLAKHLDPPAVSTDTHSRFLRHGWTMRCVCNCIVFNGLLLALRLLFLIAWVGGNYGNNAARPSHHRRSDVLAGRISADRRTHFRTNRPRGIRAPTSKSQESRPDRRNAGPANELKKTLQLRGARPCCC